MKNWSQTTVIKKWQEMRKRDGAALRDTVWKELEPLRKSLAKIK